jgi:hypothetical protein
MRKFMILIVVLCAVQIVSAQEARYYDAPFGGGGGFTPGWIFPKFDELNTQLKRFDVPEFSNGGFFTTGGAGFIYLGFIKNLRVGGMGFGGSKSVSGSSPMPILIDKSFDKNSSQAVQDNINKEVDYSIGGGGLTVEYTLPFIKTFGISLGAVIGSGSIQVDIYKNTGTFSWDNVWTDLVNPFSSLNTHRTIKNTFWFFTPTVNVDIPFLRFMIFRVSGGYQVTFANNWKIDNDQSLSNVPSGLNGNCFYIQTGIFIGFFSL